MPLKGKKILVTSGGTSEYIDDVRVMTNISTGKLGWEIADALRHRIMDEVRNASEVQLETGISPTPHLFDPNDIKDKGKIYYLHGRNAVMRETDDDIMEYIEVRSAQEAHDAMEKLVPYMDAVVHAMAVSDFTFKRDENIKCSSSDPEAFIEYMRKTIAKNPKIISKVKEWNPLTKLIGFKFEVGIPWEELIVLAKHSTEVNGCDLVIANDKAEMVREHEHIAHFVFSDAMARGIYKNYKEVRGKEAIAHEVSVFLNEVLV